MTCSIFPDMEKTLVTESSDCNYNHFVTTFAPNRKQRKIKINQITPKLLQSFSYESVTSFLLKILILHSVWLYTVHGRPAKLILYRNDGPAHGGLKMFETSTRKCRAGVFLMEPRKYTCVCLTGVWAFYTKYCKKPYMMVGGDNYCFHIEDEELLSQMILVGSPKFPFEPSLTHFREDYIIMTKTFTTDDDSLDLDALSTFVSIGATSWTLKGDTGETLCLIPENEKRKFCLFDLTHGVIDSWKVIIGVRKGCLSSNSVEAYYCEDIYPPNDEKICLRRRGAFTTTVVPSPPTKTSSFSDTTSIMDTGSSEIIGDKITLDLKPPRMPTKTTTKRPPPSSLITDYYQILPFPIKPQIPTRKPSTSTTTTTPEPMSTTTELPADYCQVGYTMDNVKEYWSSPFASLCPTSMTELIFTDQLKRFAVLQMNRRLMTRQTSLQQTEELLQIGAELMKVTCPNDAVAPEFLDVVTEAFAMFVRDDFFYGVEETEPVVYERIVFNLRTCLKRAKPFQFVKKRDECNKTTILNELILSGVQRKVVISDQNSWRNYEPLIESVWKMFLNVHSYCYEDFLRQNDHHSYSVRMLQLFSVSIYEKWIQPMTSPVLYNFIVPNAHIMETTMENLDHCVGALNFVTKCPVWLDRDSSKEPPKHGIIAQGTGTRTNRKKRSIWINHLKTNRESTQIWNGEAYCLQTPEDPSYHLGFSRCAHA